MPEAIHPSIAAKIIQNKCKSLKPKIAFILGSGLASIANKIKNAITIDYQDLPGFPTPSVDGHMGRLILGTFNDLPIACLQGRTHIYEGTSFEQFKIMFRTLKLIGCQKIITTNAVGSLREEAGPGTLMLITDYINFAAPNPLIGPNDDEFGVRFPSMCRKEEAALKQLITDAAQNISMDLAEGVYFTLTGPSYETPAEIKAIRLLGGDVVGMSAGPEIILARHCDISIVTLAAITNHAAGMNTETIKHEDVLELGKILSEKLYKILFELAGLLQNEN